MTTRTVRKFRELNARGRKALILFMTAGDPGLKKNEDLILACEKEGADILELGVPFSDPLADGPVIQASSMRALKRRTTLAGILGAVRRARRRGAELPILLMSYLNPLLRHGAARFAREARAAGVDGVIVPDLPPEEGRAFARTLRSAGLDTVYFLAPTSSDERVRRVARASSGFIYYVSLTGVTGAAHASPGRIEGHLRRIRRMARLPVCVGFGISTPAQAKRMARSADGVIVGSALVRALAARPGVTAKAFAARFVRPFRRALGEGR